MREDTAGHAGKILLNSFKRDRIERLDDEVTLVIKEHFSESYRNRLILCRLLYLYKKRNATVNKLQYVCKTRNRVLGVKELHLSELLGSIILDKSALSRNSLKIVIVIYHKLTVARKSDVKLNTESHISRRGKCRHRVLCSFGVMESAMSEFHVLES